MRVRLRLGCSWVVFPGLEVGNEMKLVNTLGTSKSQRRLNLRDAQHCDR